MGKTEYSEGRISFRLGDILDDLSPEDHREVVKMIGWEKEVLDELATELMTESVVTENCGCDIFAFREKIVEMLPEMYRNHIRSLLVMLERQKIEAKRQNDWAWKLWHYMQDRNRENGWGVADQPYPKPPDNGKYESAGWPTEKELDAVVANREEEEATDG